jgi:hypothetical protein
MHGLLKKEEHEQSVVKCPRCNRINAASEDVCGCGFVFNQVLAADLEKQKEDSIDKLEKKFGELEEKLKRLLREP